MGCLLYLSAVITPRDTPSKQTAEFVMAAGTAYLDAVKKKIRSLQRVYNTNTTTTGGARVRARSQAICERMIMI